MLDRRNFFKQFIGQFSKLYYESKGVQFIPLNKLNKLPKNIVQQLKPTLFPHIDWNIDKNGTLICCVQNEPLVELELDQVESDAFTLFGSDTDIRNICITLSERHASTHEELYEKVTLLFFKLANKAVCHPDQTGLIDDFLH